MTDVVELIERPVDTFVLGGQEAEVRMLGILSWYRLNGIKESILSALREMDWLEAFLFLPQFIEIATGVSASEILLSETLVAIRGLWELNELRYLDPHFMKAAQKRVSLAFGKLKHAELVDLYVTLASRFSHREIEEMSPEFAILCWQRIVEERADDRAVIFYSTEMGYRKQVTDKKRGAYRLIPLKSPYEPAWRVERLASEHSIVREALSREARPSPFITHPEKVIDGRNM